jgi:hypothetical protein
MLTRIIGDIHGDFNEYRRVATENFDGPTLQLGDFGIGFAGPYWHDRVNEFHTSGKHQFVRGNHDNPEKCDEMLGWIPDGWVLNGAMFIGGAWSIDYAYRTPGVSWWEDEECSYEHFQDMIEDYKEVKPQVMVTHDGPMKVTEEMFVKSGHAMGGLNARLIPTRTGQALQAMLDFHQPKFWFFGHWHKTMQYKYGETNFHCLGELDYVDFNFKTLEYGDVK